MSRVLKPYIFALFAITPLVNACATLETEDLIQKEEAAYSEIPSIWETQISSSVSRADSWVNLLEDPILASHLKTANDQNYDIAQAKINLAQAELSIEQARASLLPVVNSNGNVGGSALLRNLDSISESFGSGLSIGWDPDVFGVRRLQVDQAKLNKNIQSQLTYNTRQQILANVINIYVSIIQSDLQIDLSLRNLDFLQERLRIANAQYKVGRISLEQVSLAENNFQSAQASLEAQRLTSRQLRRSLSALLGEYDDYNPEVADSLPLVQYLPKRSSPAQILHQRADVKIAQEQINLALNSYKISVKSDWPIVSISGSIGGGGPNVSDVFDISNYILNLSSSIFGNIYDGGLNEVQREEFRLGVEAAILNYKNVLRIAKNDIENSYDQAGVNDSQLESLRAAAEAGDKALELEQIRFDLGKSDLLSVLQVQQSALSTNVSLINSQASIVTTLVDAYLATGGDLAYD